MPAQRPGHCRADDAQSAGALSICSTRNRSEADRIHLLAEATKAAYSARDAYFCDPVANPFDVSRYLSDEYADRDARGDRVFAVHPQRLVLRRGGAQGHGLSLPLSIATATPSPSSTRCSRSLAAASWRRTAACCFTAAARAFASAPGHPNAIGPRKRPLHTIIPGMLVKNGRAVMPFGVMGGHYQATGHAHFLTRLLARWSRSTGRGRGAAQLRLWRRAATRADDRYRHRCRARTAWPRGCLHRETAGRLPSHPD